MRFSVWPNPGWGWDQVLDLALHVEEDGWDGIWFADHFMPNTDEGTPADGPVLECWATLAGLAVAVPRVRLGSLVCGNTYRHPAVLANIAASVDHLSGGRLVLGLGAGWQQNEHDAYGIGLPPVGDRLDRLEEACAVVTGLLADRRTTVDGRHYTVTDAPCDPKPVGDRLPLLIGGGGERRTLAIAARHADEWNVWGTPDTLAHKGTVLDRHCADQGRDPATIARSAQALVRITDEPSDPPKGARPALRGTPAQIAEHMAAYADAGVDEFIIPCFDTPERARALVDRFTAEVRPLVDQADRP